MARAQYTKLQNVVFCTIKSINRRLDDSLDIPQTVSLALDEFWKRLHVDCWVYTIDQSQKRALLIAYKGLGKNVAEELTACGMNDDFVARLVSSAKPLVICNLIDSPVYKESMLVRAGYRSLVIIPVRLAKKPIAVLGLALKTDEGLTNHELQTLDTFTSYLAAIIDKSTIRQQKNETEKTLTVVNNLTRIITSSLNISDVYEGFTEELRKTMDVDWSSIVIIDGQELRFYALSSKIDCTWKVGDTLPLAGTAIEYVAATKELLVEPDLACETKFWTGKYHLEQGIRSLVYLPLLLRGEVFGALIVASRRPDAYGEKELTLLKQVVAQIAVPVQNARLFEDTEQKKRFLTSIVRITKAITSDTDFSKVFQTFTEELQSLVRFDRASITIVEGDRIRFLAASQDMPVELQTGKTYPLKNSATGWVLENKRTLIQTDIARHGLSLTDDIKYKAGLRSSIHVPLASKGEIFGSLNLSSREPNAYGEKEKEILEQFANQIAETIWSSQLYVKAEQRARTDELTGLYNRRYFEECLDREIDRHTRYGGTLSLVILDLDSFKTYNDIHGHLAGDKVLNQIGHLIKRTIRKIDLAFRYGGDEFALILPHTGVEQAYIVAERVRKRISSGILAKQLLFTASFGLATWPGDGATSDELCNAADYALYYAKRTGGNRIQIAAKTLFNTRDSSLTTGATAEKGILSIIQALAAAVEARDIYTHGHSRRVRDYSVALAEALGLPSDRIANLSTAALLHDIGKIGIPDELLRKNDKMTAEQWEIIQSHTKLAAAIVGRIPSLTPCLPAILHHHERWDGNGYPTGLRGEAIPLEARILAIADAFEAMTASRPYHQPMTLSKAINELKRNAGAQFDPRLVEIFLNIIPRLFTETSREKPNPEEHTLI